MEGASLRYTGLRARRRSLECMMKEAALLSNQGSNEDTTRHSVQSIEDEMSGSSSEVSSSSSGSDRSGSSDSSEDHDSAPKATANSILPSEEVLQREFRSVFLSQTDSSPPSASPPPSIESIQAQLQTIIDSLDVIKCSLEEKHDSRLANRATTAGAAAYELGRSAVSHYANRIKLTPSPAEFGDLHNAHVTLLQRMRSAVKSGEARPTEKVNLIRNPQESERTITSQQGNHEVPDKQITCTDAVDDYLYRRRSAQVSHAFECRRCGRHFGSDITLSHHHCTNPATIHAEVVDEGAAQRMACRHCGRQMTAKALAHHENVCIRIFHGRRRP